VKQITSKDNPVCKSIRHLARSSRARREEGMIVFDGVHLVRAYLERFGAEAVELVVRKSAATHAEIAALVKQAHCLIMSDTLFDQLATVESPVGILALAPLPKVTPPGHVGGGFEVVLDGIQDPGNVGAILRSAAAAGARHAHLSMNCADPWSPKCLRGGMGAQFLLAVRQHENLATAARDLDAKLIACTAEAKTSLFDADLDGRVAFVVGGEGRGISPALIAVAQQEIRIPMRPGVESLNVAAAAAICFYEWVRRGES
jgi:TrmH family RNA methyltransferase